MDSIYHGIPYARCGVFHRTYSEHENIKGETRGRSNRKKKQQIVRNVDEKNVGSIGRKK